MAAKSTCSLSEAPVQKVWPCTEAAWLLPSQSTLAVLPGCVQLRSWQTQSWPGLLGFCVGISVLPLMLAVHCLQAGQPGWWPRKQSCLLIKPCNGQQCSARGWVGTGAWARLSCHGLINFHCRLHCYLCASTLSSRFKLITSISAMTKHCFCDQAFHSKWLFVFRHENIGLSGVIQFFLSLLPPSLLPDLCV